MKRDMDSTLLCLALVGMLLLASFSACSTAHKSQTDTPSSATAPTTAAPAASEVQPVSLPAPQGSMPMAPYYPPPATMDLCGEPVPLHIQDVLERFDKEFTLVVYNHAQVYLWLKRMERYFPWIEQRLKTYQLPDDLKYVVIAESDLLPNACSPKGAAGPWQFMPSTGSSYGLEQQRGLDKRYDFERATDSALRLLQDLNERYRNWALAIAAYNCGDKRILEESRSQGVTDYYLMQLPAETERYVFRILAIKAVLSHPERYGYHLPKGQGYPEHSLDRVSVNLSRPVPIQTIASAGEITYREFKSLNPAFRSETIPAGSFELNFPEGKGTKFERNFEALSVRTAAAESEIPEPAPRALDEDFEPIVQARPAPVPVQKAPERVAKASTLRATPVKVKQSKNPPASHHQVKKGETLSSIADRYKVSTQTLRQANKLKGSTITPGQKLRIR